jgi:hypothetical protein
VMIEDYEWILYLTGFAEAIERIHNFDSKM